jgi:hypothetical protein
LRLVRSSKPEIPPRESLTYPPAHGHLLADPRRPLPSGTRILPPRARGASSGEHETISPGPRPPVRRRMQLFSSKTSVPPSREAGTSPASCSGKNTLAGALRTGLSPFVGPFLEHRESLLGPPDITARDHARCHARCHARASELRFGGDGQLRVEGVLRARGDCPQPPRASVFGGARCARRGWADSPGHRPGGHCRCRWRRPHRATRRFCPTPRATAAP